MTQGQSLSTIDKERQMAAMLDMEIKIVRVTCPRSIFRYIDLNAGSGWNEEFNVPGSPVVFAELAEELLGPRWHAYLFERDPVRFRELSNRFDGHRQVTLYGDDNARILEAARRFLTTWDIGCVVADPNAWMYRNRDGEGVPVSQLIQFTERYPRMDLLANLNGRTYRLQRGAREHGRATYTDFHGLGDNCANFLRLFHKNTGLITTLSSNGHSQFVRLILRNKATRDYKAWGWYHLNSPQAHRVYQWLESDNQHFNGTKELFPLL